MSGKTVGDFVRFFKEKPELWLQVKEAIEGLCKHCEGKGGAVVDAHGMGFRWVAECPYCGRKKNY